MTPWLRISLLLCGALPMAAAAQSYPVKPVRVLVSAPAGGQSDITARLIGTELGKRLGQAFVIENRPGNPTIGGKALSSAAPDGYTLYAGGANSMSAIFNKNNAVNVAKEWAPVSNILTGSYFFLVSSKIPASSLQELVAYTKQNPRKLNFGTPGTAVPELVMKVVADRTGMDFTPILYRGSPQVITAMLSGEVAFSINSLAAYKGMVQDGSVRPLFVTTEKRSSVMPNVPTAEELGVKQLKIGFQNGLWSPAGTPPAIRNQLSALVGEVVRLPEVSNLIRTSAAADPDPSTPEEQLRKFEAEEAFWQEAARIAKFEPQ